ncbi:MAG: response regulator [Halobacteriales archaeon]
MDDEEDVASMYATWLDDGYDVREAHGGDEALDVLEDEDVDVVLLDRRMPDIKGEEVLERLRDRGHDCRVAVVTAVEPDFDIIDMGFDDYLTKPVSRDELLDTVEALVNRSRYSEKTREQYALVRKKTALEESKSHEEIEGSEEYDRLVDEIQEVSEETRELLDEMRDEDYRRVLEELD